jgi:hypothetical protein
MQALHIGPGDRNFLPFATGKFHTVLKSLESGYFINDFNEFSDETAVFAP